MNQTDTDAALAIAHSFMLERGITPPTLNPNPPPEPAPIFAEDPEPTSFEQEYPILSSIAEPRPDLSVDGLIRRAAQQAKSAPVGEKDLAFYRGLLGPAHSTHYPTAPTPPYTPSTPIGVGVMEQLLTEIGGLRASIDKLCMILGAK